MIIGNGMMAKAFSQYQDSSSVLVFASGVANSRETEQTAFAREKLLLIEALRVHADKTFVYFGTCSAGDPDAAKSPYVLHKLSMETLISNTHSRYNIFRLPQAVGRSVNRTTLVNYFYDMIVRGEPFIVWNNAFRYLIDVEDVVRIAGHIIDRDLYRNKVLNIAADRYPVVEIVRVLEKIAGVKGAYTIVDRGEPFSVDVAVAKSIADELNIEFDGSYLERTLRKYYPSITPERS